MAESKVTMTFSGYDNSADKSVMFEGPLRINKILDDITGLNTYDISGFSKGDSIIAFVRNVNYNGTAVAKGSIAYRGAFFRYDWDLLGWQQIMLGTHSHANIALLDELGQISTEGMAAGDEKVLKIKKTSASGSSTDSDYSIGFSDGMDIPDPPSDSEGKTLYLTRGSDGKLAWTNYLVPSQTFCVLNLKISDSVRPSGDSSRKSIIISNDALTAANASYDKNSGDEILTFDGGQLIAASSEAIDSGIKVTIADSETGHTFDDGETVTFVILRNGVNGLLTSINRNFATKADLVSLSSNGTVDLNAYETKSDYQADKARFSKVGHAHPEYLRKDDYNAFDWRYADYNHTHAQYVTRNDVLAILSDAVGDSGSVSTDEAMAKVVADIEFKLSKFNDLYYTKTATAALIDSKISQATNTDAITDSSTGLTLSDSLTDMRAGIASASVSTTDKVTSKPIKVNLGSGNSIGGYSDGESINNGTTLTAVLTKLMTKEKVPELENPEFTVAMSQTTTASGKISTAKFEFSYKQGNAGALKAIRLRVYPKKDPSDSDSPDLDLAIDPSQASYERTGQLIPSDESGFCYSVRIDASYYEGDVVESNISGKAYMIYAGTISKTINVFCERKYLFGYLTFGIDDEGEITGDTINEALKASKVSEYDDNDISSAATEITFQNESGAQTMIFAEPESKESQIKKIYYKQQGYDATSLFKRKDHVQIKDDGGLASGLSPLYTVYYLAMKQPIKSDMTFRLVF